MRFSRVIHVVAHIHQFCQLLYFILFYFGFLGPYLQHMEVPRLGVKLELQLPAYTTATATPDPSCICDLCPDHGNAGSPTH